MKVEELASKFAKADASSKKGLVARPAARSEQQMRLPGLLAGRKDFRHGPSSLDFDGGEDGGGGGEADPDPEATFFTELWQQKRLLPPIDSPYSSAPRWRQMLLLFTMYEQIYIPMQLAFHQPSPSHGAYFQMPVIQLLLQV